MKVHVWSKFRKNKIWKKVKSPLSMNFWRISTSKCRGTLQKMGYCAHTPARSPGPCYMQGPEKKTKKNVTFFFGKKVKKNGATSTVAACTGCDCGCCAIFFYLFSEKKGDIFFSFFFRPLHVARAWTSCGGVCTVSHFLKCAPTLGSANSSKIHGEWRFHFFPNFVFPKFTSYMDLHIYRWDFCFMKKLIP
jgi:hypothetical protein